MPSSAASNKAASVRSSDPGLVQFSGAATLTLGLLVILYGLYALGSYLTPISDNATLCFLVIGFGVLLSVLGIALLDPPGGSGPLPGDGL